MEVLASIAIRTIAFEEKLPARSGFVINIQMYLFFQFGFAMCKGTLFKLIN